MRWSRFRLPHSTGSRNPGDGLSWKHHCRPSVRSVFVHFDSGAPVVRRVRDLIRFLNCRQRFCAYSQATDLNTITKIRAIHSTTHNLYNKNNIYLYICMYICRERLFLNEIRDLLLSDRGSRSEGASTTTGDLVGEIST